MHPSKQPSYPYNSSYPPTSRTLTTLTLLHSLPSPTSGPVVVLPLVHTLRPQPDDQVPPGLLEAVGVTLPLDTLAVPKALHCTTFDCLSRVPR